jgi:hypothetical protein
MTKYAGSAVAVERVFSGGRDTISLRRAILQPNIIRILMLVKQRLCFTRVAITLLRFWVTDRFILILLYHMRIRLLYNSVFWFRMTVWAGRMTL